MICVKFFKLPTVLTIALKLNGSFQGYNDIAMFIDKKKSVVLVLLDLSAAFDRVDRSLLLSRLSACFGICHQALDWLRSYLSECTHTSEFKMSLQMCMLALPY